MGKVIPPFISPTDRGYKFLCTFQILGLNRSEEKVVWVEGGIPPYSWAISGTAFTLSAPSTNVQYNFVTATDDATLGVEETITVVDSNSEGVLCNVKLIDYNEYDCCGGGIETPHLKDCCTEEYSFSYGGNDTPTPGTTIHIWYEGGCSPFYWEVIDNSDYLTVISSWTNEPTNLIVISSDAPPGLNIETSIEVTDFCDRLCCNAYTEPEIDVDESDFVISPSSPATVVIEGGCPPYVWYTADLGYTIDPNEPSEGLFAVVSVVGGTCEDDYYPSCTIRITDDCGTIFYHKLLNTCTTPTCSNGAGWEFSVHRNRGSQPNDCRYCSCSPLPDTHCILIINGCGRWKYHSYGSYGECYGCIFTGNTFLPFDPGYYPPGCDVPDGPYPTPTDGVTWNTCVVPICSASCTNGWARVALNLWKCGGSDTGC